MARCSQDSDQVDFRYLARTEQPKPGTLIGVDAEFVALQQEELEIKADGSRSTLRPSRLGLARVSVLRGSAASSDLGPSSRCTPDRRGSGDTSSPESSDNYVPFIDDYIHITDPVVDYLTAYSGISPGDLSPHSSPHAATGRLVSLKTAYKKIWLLLNLGCIFVGHGLPKDFRTINIHVPRAQVIDTVDLFYLKSRGRKLSLRFLSWLLLDERVQTGMHDSVEDARMALRLWRKWQEYEDAGVTEQVLQQVYARGRECGFRVPEDERVQGGLAHLNLGGMPGIKTSLYAAGTADPQATLDIGASSPKASPLGASAGRAAGLVAADEGMDGATR